jgi:hypothetical protein
MAAVNEIPAEQSAIIYAADSVDWQDDDPAHRPVPAEDNYYQSKIRERHALIAEWGLPAIAATAVAVAGYAALKLFGKNK